MACIRTQGKNASPVAGSTYSGWCWCQMNATFSGASAGDGASDETPLCPPGLLSCAAATATSSNKAVKRLTAPAKNRAGRRAPRRSSPCLKYRHAIPPHLSLTAMAVRVSTFDAALRQARNQLLLQQQEDDHDGDGRNQGA